MFGNLSDKMSVRSIRSYIDKMKLEIYHIYMDSSKPAENRALFALVLIRTRLRKIYKNP